MDPDANLCEQRAIIGRNIDWLVPDTHDMVRLMDLVNALDEWLSSGGYPPGGWTR